MNYTLKIDEGPPCEATLVLRAGCAENHMGSLKIGRQPRPKQPDTWVSLQRFRIDWLGMQPDNADCCNTELWWRNTGLGNSTPGRENKVRRTCGGSELAEAEGS